MNRADVVVLGGGPGGYVCAMRAAQLGLSTALIERDGLGGECLNYGCIPSKSLITVSKLFEKVRNGAAVGLKAEHVEVDLPSLQRWKSGVVRKLVSGIESLCKGNGVEVVRGEAEVVEKGRVSVSVAGKVEEFDADRLVLATGSLPVGLPGAAFDGKLVIGSKEALELSTVPGRMLIVGGGAVGLEMACMFQKFGSTITVVELTDQLLPGTEPELVRVVQKNLETRGAKILLKSKLASLERGDVAKAVVDTPEGKVSIEAEKVLLSVGRRPRTEKLNLARIGVATDKQGYVMTDEHMMTNVPGVYAIGDLKGPPLLAHKASKEGIVAAESIAGLSTAADWTSIANVVFTDPEIASVGLTEAQAASSGRSVMTTRFPYAILGRALSANEPDGQVKIVSEKGSGLVLGVQIVSADASNLISEAALAVEMGATVEDVALTIHPHPTLSEAIMEAAQGATGNPIHQLKKT